MKKIAAMLLALVLLTGAFPAFGSEIALDASDRDTIEFTLNLSNNPDQEWTYNAQTDSWTLSVVSAVAYPELCDQQGVSVCVPAAYVKGIDTNGDGTADETEGTVKGSLVIDYESTIISTNGQAYSASTAPLLMTTGAAGYGSQNNALASANYAKEGYVTIACGNRGKQDTAVDEKGNRYYTGDAPSCLVDQKAAARFVKYNILLGNLPGCPDYLVVTGGSGGAAHAAMFAATSNHPDFYDYLIEAGAVGVYQTGDGTYDTTVKIGTETVPLSDGAWGAIAYSAITSLYEADAAQAFEYYLDADFDFSTPFQKQLAEYLSEAYMNYINNQSLTADEARFGLDINGDGDQTDIVSLTIEYDPNAHPETNGYSGTYLELYRLTFVKNLQWYLDHLDYADSWTWFDNDGNRVSDMTAEEKALAFIEGRYAKGSTGGMGMIPMGAIPQNGPDGGFPGGMMGEKPDGGPAGPGAMGDLPGGMMGDLPGGMPDDAEEMFGKGIRDGGPQMGTTASAGGKRDSSNYTSFDEMAADYAKDISEITSGDAYGKNIVSLYNPISYIGSDDTEAPAWTRIVMGAKEGDISMMSSLNLQIAWLQSGTDAAVEWQWDGGHVPGEIFGNSLPLYIDTMYGKYISGVPSVKPAPSDVSDGDEDAPSGSDLSGWVDASDISSVDFSLADVLSYRNAGASKAVPGFDVIDHGQENYVFGNQQKDARHWNAFLSDIFENEEYALVLRELFNAEQKQ